MTTTMNEYINYNLTVLAAETIRPFGKF